MELQIETTKKGTEKELALAKLRQQKEIEEAKKAGAFFTALRLLPQKHGLENKLFEMQGITSGMQLVSTRGTFSASAVAGLGTGNVQERIAKAAEKAINKAAEQIAVMTGVKTAVEKINLGAAI